MGGYGQWEQKDIKKIFDRTTIMIISSFLHYETQK